MSDFEQERLVDAAFGTFRLAGEAYVGPPGVAAVHRTVRHRRTTHRVGGVASVAAVAVAVMLGISALPGRSPQPPVVEASTPISPPPSSAGPLPTGPSPANPPTPSAPPARPDGSPSGRPTETGRPSGREADLTVYASTMTLSQPDGSGRRSGALGVRVENYGPAAATGIRLTVRTPRGIRPDPKPRVRCELTGGGPYECAAGPIAAGEGASFMFWFTVGPEFTGSPAAGTRWVSVAPDGGGIGDPDPDDNTATYVIQIPARP